MAYKKQVNRAELEASFLRYVGRFDGATTEGWRRLQMQVDQETTYMDLADLRAAFDVKGRTRRDVVYEITKVMEFNSRGKR